MLLLLLYCCADNNADARGSMTTTIGAICLLLSISLVNTAPEIADVYLNRLNFGVIATRQNKVSVIEGYHTHVYHLSLPAALYTAAPRPINATGCDTTKCQQAMKLYITSRNFTTTLRNAITKLIRRIYMLTGYQRRTPNRGKTPRVKKYAMDFIGDASSWLFGLSTVTQVNEVRKLIEQIKLGYDAAAVDSAGLRDSMSTFEKLQNKRMDDLHTAIDLENQALGNVNSHIDDLQRSLTVENGIMTFMLNELRQFTEIHDTITDLANGIDDMIRGVLSPHIIPVEEATRLLANTRRTLERKQLKLCYQTTRELYQSSNFVFYRSAAELFIILRLPYARHKPLTKYKTNSFPMPFSGKPGFLTELKNFPTHIIADLKSGIIGELTTNSNSAFVESTAVIWHKAFSKSCAFEILTNNDNEVHKACDFSVRQAGITPTYVNIANGMYVLSNVRQVRTQCRGHITERQTHHCGLCIVHLNCTCSLLSADFNISEEFSTCDATETSDSSLLAAVNLPVIKHFYDTTNLTLTGDSLFSPENIPRLAPASWSLFSNNISSILASDTTNSYSLAKIADTIQNGTSTTILHNPSEALLYEFLQQRMSENTFWKFHPYSWMTWTTLLTLTMIIFGLVTIYRLHCRVQFLILMIANKPTATGAVETTETSPAYFIPRLTITPATPPIDSASRQLGQLLADEVRYVDAFTLTLFTITVGVFILIIWMIKRNASRRTALYLQIRNKTRALQMRIMTFPNGMRFFSINTPREPIKITMTHLCVRVLFTIEAKKWRVKNTLTGERIAVPSDIWLTPWNAFRLKQLIHDGEYTIEPLLIHSHEFHYLVPKQRSTTDA